MTTKSVKNLTNGTSDKLDNIYYGEDLTDIGGSIAEEYIDGRLKLHIHIGFSSEEYCAIFNNRDSQVNSCNSSEFGVCARHTQFLSQRAPSEQQVSMLIYVTKDLEIPKIPPIAQIPTVFQFFGGICPPYSILS